MTSGLATVAYIAATILFILSLGGLSHPETARRGNLFGIIGMTIAVLATVFGPRVTPEGYAWIVGALVVAAVEQLWVGFLGVVVFDERFLRRLPVAVELLLDVQLHEPARHVEVFEMLGNWREILF